MAKHYFSYRGRLGLAPITNGVMGAIRDIGNMPNLQLSITADKFEHTESQSGHDAVDLIIYNVSAVTLSGTIEELEKENLALVVSGKNTDVVSEVVAPYSLGAVTKGQKIKLDGFNLTAVAVKDGADPAVAIDASKYKLDADFGTITFLDAIPAVTIGYTTGAVTHTTIASNFGQEYAIFFEGVNKVNKEQKIFMQLHRATKTPETTLDLIGAEGVSAIDVEFDVLGDVDKDEDPTLGIFGYIAYPKEPVTP